MFFLILLSILSEGSPRRLLEDINNASMTQSGRHLQGCFDVQPPKWYKIQTCALQESEGKCKIRVQENSIYCRKTCGMCGDKMPTTIKPTSADLDCKVTFSPCTASCEKANERIWYQTQAKYGNGKDCPKPENCKDGDGECECVDIQPPSSWDNNTCQKQKEGGKCQNRREEDSPYCRLTCGSCSPTPEPAAVSYTLEKSRYGCGAWSSSIGEFFAGPHTAEECFVECEKKKCNAFFVGNYGHKGCAIVTTGDCDAGLVFGRNFDYYKVTAASIVPDTAKTYEMHKRNTGCGGWHDLAWKRFFTEQYTKDTCADECARYPECQAFYLMHNGKCALTNGQCSMLAGREFDRYCMKSASATCMQK